jgi:hypothetical protein
VNPAVITALAVGIAIGLFFGVQLGRWLGFLQLGQWELKQRMFRAKHWRRGY